MDRIVLQKFNIMNFISELYKRNKLLANLGTLFLALAILLAVYAPFNTVEVLGINSMIKPIKFALSIWIYAWSFAYLLFYFEEQKRVQKFSKFAAFVMIFEQAVITFQAFRGKLSHFNQTEVFGGILYALMGIFIVWLTVSTLFLSIRFIKQKSFSISKPFALSIQIGLIVFVIFSFFGGYMSAINTHTVGGEIGQKGLPLVNWSTFFGDLRIAHFFGVHALQVIPFAGFLISKYKSNEKSATRFIWLISILYFLFVSFTAYQALTGNPFISH